MSHIEPGPERSDDLINLDDPTAEAATQAAVGGSGGIIALLLAIVAAGLIIAGVSLFGSHLVSAIVLVLLGVAAAYGAYTLFKKSRRVWADRVSV